MRRGNEQNERLRERSTRRRTRMTVQDSWGISAVESCCQGRDRWLRDDVGDGERGDEDVELLYAKTWMTKKLYPDRMTKFRPIFQVT